MAYMIHGGDIEIGLAVMDHGGHIVTVAQTVEDTGGGVVPVHQSDGTSRVNIRAVNNGIIVTAGRGFQGIDVVFVCGHTLRGYKVIGQVADSCIAPVVQIVACRPDCSGEKAAQHGRDQKQGNQSVCFFHNHSSCCSSFFHYIYFSK